MSTHNIADAILISTHNKDDKKYLSIIIKYYQIHTLSLFLENVLHSPIARNK